MVGIYKMIIRWCNDKPTLTDGEWSTGSNKSNPAVAKSDDKNKNVSGNSDYSLSSCETDMNLSRTRKRTPKSVKITTPVTKNKNTDNNTSKNSVNNDLISFDDGLSLDKFQDALHISSH